MKLFRPALIQWIPLLALACAGASVRAHAAPPISPAAIGPTGSMPWSDTTRFDECDQACLYEKANENITLQIGYIKERIGVLDEELRNHNDSAVISALGELCLSSEAAQDCLGRYKRIEVLHIQKLRAALIHNEDARARLMSYRQGYDDGRVEGQQIPAFEKGAPLVAGPPKLAQTPYVPTYDDLRQQFDAESIQLRILTSAQYRDWLNHLPTRPSRDDFVKMRRVYRNPQNPLDGYISEIDTDPAGNLRYDDDAYQVALADYQQKEQTWRSELPRLTQANVSPRGSLGLDAISHPEDKKALGRARVQMVTQANLVIQRDNPGRIVSVAEMQFGGPAAASGRAPSAATPPPAPVAMPVTPAQPGAPAGPADSNRSASLHPGANPTTQDPIDPNAQVMGVRHNPGDTNIETTTVARDPHLVLREIGQIENVSYPDTYPEP